MNPRVFEAFNDSVKQTFNNAGLNLHGGNCDIVEYMILERTGVLEKLSDRIKNLSADLQCRYVNTTYSLFFSDDVDRFSIRFGIKGKGKGKKELTKEDEETFTEIRKSLLLSGYSKGIQINPMHNVDYIDNTIISIIITKKFVLDALANCSLLKAADDKHLDTLDAKQLTTLLQKIQRYQLIKNKNEIEIALPLLIHKVQQRLLSISPAIPQHDISKVEIIQPAKKILNFNKKDPNKNKNVFQLFSINNNAPNNNMANDELLLIALTDIENKIKELTREIDAPVVVNKKRKQAKKDFFQAILNTFKDQKDKVAEEDRFSFLKTVINLKKAEAKEEVFIGKRTNELIDRILHDYPELQQKSNYQLC